MGEENFLRQSRRLKRKQHNEPTGNLQIEKNRKLSSSIIKSAKKIKLCKQSASKKYPERLANNNQLYKAAALHLRNGNPETVSSIDVLKRISPRILKKKKINYVETKEDEMGEENFLRPSRSLKRKQHNKPTENLQIEKNRKLSSSIIKSAKKIKPCKQSASKKYPERLANNNQLYKAAALHLRNGNLETVSSIDVLKRISPRILKKKKINYVETKEDEENFLRKSRRLKRKQHNESAENLQIEKNHKLSSSINKSAKKIKLCKQSASKKYPERLANNNQIYKAAALHLRNGNLETVSSIDVLKRISPRILKKKKVNYVETKEGEKMAEENFLKSRRHKRKQHNSIENLQVKENLKLSISVNKSVKKTQSCRKSSQKKYPKRSSNCSQLCKPAVLHPTNDSITAFSTVESKRTSPRLSKMEKINYVETKNKYSSDVDNLKPGESVLKKRKNKLSNKKTLEVVARRYTFPLETGYRKSLKSNKLGGKQASSMRNSYNLKNIHADSLSSEKKKMAMAALYVSNFKHLKNVPVDDLFKLKPSENCKVIKTARKVSDNPTLKGINNSESPCALLKKVPHGISERNSKIRISDKVIEEFHSNCNEILPDCNDDPKKRPRKKTLKHKRWLFEKLRDNSSGYEDDIYESKSFDSYKCLTQLESESEASFNIATPQCSFAVTPIVLTKRPAFKDCFSPTELMRNRKHAEEYMYRRHNRKVESEKSQVQEPEIPEKRKLDFEETLSVIRNKLKSFEESVNQGYSSDEENLSDT